MDITDKEKKYLLGVYKKNPIVVRRALGKYIYDDKGRRYLDFFSGLSVCNFGHCNPSVISAVSKQLKRYLHISNLYTADVQAELAEKLVAMTFGKKSGARVFFSNSGAEANECAVKIARKWGSSSGKYEIITFDNSFHGRTLATLSATAQNKFHKGFEPLPQGFRYAVFNDLSSVKTAFSRNKTAAIMVEPVQGEGGVRPARYDFLKSLRKFCDEKNILLIFDEIQTGLGRCGADFAFKIYDVTPDIITLAKALGGGLPLGATIVGGKLRDVFGAGDHGSTFGGNPVSCAASLAVLSLLQDKVVLKNVNTVGNYFKRRLLGDLKNRYPSLIKDVRGMGLMIGVELNQPGAPVVGRCLEKGLLINVTQDKVLRFLPPLTITRKDADKALKIIDEALSFAYKKIAYR